MSIHVNDEWNLTFTIWSKEALPTWTLIGTAKDLTSSKILTWVTCAWWDWNWNYKWYYVQLCIKWTKRVQKMQNKLHTKLSKYQLPMWKKKNKHTNHRNGTRKDNNNGTMCDNLLPCNLLIKRA